MLENYPEAKTKAVNRYIEITLAYLKRTTNDEGAGWKHAAMDEAEWFVENIFGVDARPIYNDLYQKVQRGEA